MDVIMILILMFSLQMKHFVFDFILQPSFMYLNKGNIFHCGGWLHAGLHSVATVIILAILGNLSLSMLTSVFMLELFWHYITDYSKVNICSFYGWKANTSEKYWWMMGLDQLSHQLCYLAIILLVI